MVRTTTLVLKQRVTININIFNLDDLIVMVASIKHIILFSNLLFYYFDINI
jgi:hypothetical protein